MSEARFIAADRAQLRWDMIDLEAMLASDHRVRVVWDFVESLDISALYAGVKSREGAAGRPPADPAVLLALWLYATVEGVGSARQLERLAQADLAYRWLAGGVPLNYHGLADFRVEHVEILDRLLTQSVAALVGEGLVSLDEIAIDGTKVRASASKQSFRRGAKLLDIEAAVEKRLAALKAELTDDPAASGRRRQAAQERAARGVKERAQRARAALVRLEAEREERKKSHGKDEAGKSPPRASTSDPDARYMRFPDGAVRPGYNAQIAAAAGEGVIVAIEMTDRRNDAGLAMPMVDDIAAMAARPTDCWSTPATPPARTSRRWPSTPRARFRSSRRRRPSATTSSRRRSIAAKESGPWSPTASSNGANAWPAKPARRSMRFVSKSSASTPTARTTVSASSLFAAV
jgi:transposase